ncbi:MAG: hypothetical protein OEW75_16880, partial [Cyclobacteriaceae bacterium]|nr:hypothetical protein [Cyclobacteriaceae bacterium]
MKSNFIKHFFSSLAILLLIWVSGCLQPNTFPETPEISIKELSFSDAPDLTPDTLSIVINFQDGDGDLGLDSQYDIDHPYNDKYYFTWAPEIQHTVKFTAYYKVENSIPIIYYSAFFETKAEMDAFVNQYLSAVSFTYQ